MFGRKDLELPVIKDYITNYERMAEEDLSTGIVPDRYIVNLASNLIKVIGNVKGENICDIGSGKGYVLQGMLDSGAQTATAVDISVTFLRSIALKTKIIRCVQANAENLPFKEEFDVLVSTDVMEHVLNPGAFLYSVNQALKPKGKFVVRVPYRENLLNYAPQCGCKYQFAHLRTFNKILLEDALSGAGFKVTRFRLDSFLPARPQPFWNNGSRRLSLFLKWQAWIDKHLESRYDVTLWPPWLASFFMPPLEIIAVAEKAHAIEPLPSGGFQLSKPFQ
jgi:SAM-dependent methyltransferase